MLVDIDTGEYCFLGACMESFFDSGILVWAVFVVINRACVFYLRWVCSFYFGRACGFCFSKTFAFYVLSAKRGEKHSNAALVKGGAASYSVGTVRFWRGRDSPGLFYLFSTFLDEVYKGSCGDGWSGLLPLEVT